jgi:hypothetical protein
MSEIKDKTIVLRLQSGKEVNGLQGGIKDFGKYTNALIYNDEQINAIESSNKESPHEPTSIPSPFARMALAKTAFAEVARHGEKALGAYQKIVSDSLDVAEIFFTFDKWSDEIEIITWKREVNLEEKYGSEIFKNTLNLFLKNDAESYNFQEKMHIYMLKHKNSGKMIGATSPCTLFFSSPNKTAVNIPLSNNHSAFNGIFPLHKRSWDFQRYLYTWKKLNQDTRKVDGKDVFIFDELYKYLDAQKPLTNRVNDIDNNLPDDFSEYDELRNFSVDVNVLGKKLHKRKANDATSISYLTTNDLLESKIIRLPYKIQKNSFFDGNLNETSRYSYLLPVTDTFFKYYSVQELRKWIQITEIGTNVEVKLENPDLQQDIKIVYRESDSMLKVERDFDCMLFPNVKFADPKDAYYRFGLFLPYAQKNQMNEYSAAFYAGSNQVKVEKPVIRNTNDAENPICKTYLLTQKNFDRVKISHKSGSGILLPNLPDKGNIETFTFAVDFGTTNTHIEYKNTSNNTIRPFDIQENDKQIHFLLGSSESNTLAADIDFTPPLIGAAERFKFPIRSALSLAKNRKDTAKVYPFAQANVLIPYEKRLVPEYNKALTQLKWDSTEEEMGYFIDSLCFMLRNKVMLSNGNLRETKIVWFYPLNMAGERAKIIRKKWQLSYAKYFLGAVAINVNDLEEKVKENCKKNIFELPESIAPFLFYRDADRYKSYISNLISIDIGGGTTDIVFVKDGETVKYTTSFRFAANSVFGLGEHITPIVSKYRYGIEEIIAQNDPQFKLRNILESITKSALGDLASFFFSLSNNEMLKDVSTNFYAMLEKDSSQKLVFVLFYAAIIYHAAQIMKAKEGKEETKLPLPRYIAFSGNGSRIANIIADNQVLAVLSKCIFKKVYGEKHVDNGLEIIQNTKNPKEVTCKGGIKAADAGYVQPTFEAVVLLGVDDTTFAADKDTYMAVNVEDCALKTKNQAKAFVSYVLNDLLTQKYTKGVVAETFVRALNLNPQALQIAKNVCDRDGDFITSAKNGIQRKIDSISNTANTQIEETFFFYPIASLLNTISIEINEINK